MTERAIKAPLPTGEIVDAFDVPVAESNEKWSELTLEDGTVMKIKMNVVSAIRVPNHYDAEGNALYLVKGQPAMVIISVPEHLRKK